MNDISPQVRTNACAGYLFLAPFFLLAVGNPALAHPFVRMHARYALMLQAAIAAAYAVFGWWGAAGDMAVPYAGVSVGRALETAAYLAATLGLFAGVVAAARGRRPALLAAGADAARRASGARLEADAGLGESAKSRIMASYVPFLGFFAAAAEPHPGARVGARASAWYAALAMSLAIFWRADASLSAFTLGYVLLASTVAVQLFVFNRVWRWAWLESLPDAQRAGLLVRAAGDWSAAALGAVFGRKGEFSYRALLARRADLEGVRDAVYARRFDEPKFPGAPWMAYLPVVNVFLALAVRGTRSRWIPALGQGVPLAVLAAAAWFAAPSLAPFLAFPTVLGMANAARDPLYKVPLAFELSALVRRAWDRAGRAAASVADTGRRVETVSLPVGQGPRQ